MLKGDIERIKLLMKEDDFLSTVINEAELLLNGNSQVGNLRDDFAISTMHSLMTNQNIINGIANKETTIKAVAKSAYEIADIMLEVR